jgi:hypothetical protein
MRKILKISSISLIIAGLTACGGSGGGSSTPKASSAMAASSIAALSSVAASSIAPSSTPASSMAASSMPAEGDEKITNAQTNANGVTVAEIQNCGVNISAAAKTFAFFADYDGGIQNQSLSSLNFSGWNHATNGMTAEWTNLSKAGTTYNFSTSAKVNDSCNGVDTINMVLVKKVADWDHQHANGFEKNILAMGYKFGDIENLVFDLKINSANTLVPSVASLKTTYASYVTAATIDAMDAGKVNLGITLHDGGNLNGAIIIELDQAALLDKWVRVTIPMNKMTFYSEVNYVRTNKTLADLSNTVIQRGLFVAETKSGNVLRGNISNWDTVSVPETFKEVDFSFKKIEFQLK